MPPSIPATTTHGEVVDSTTEQQQQQQQHDENASKSVVTPTPTAVSAQQQTAVDPSVPFPLTDTANMYNNASMLGSNSSLMYGGGGGGMYGGGLYGSGMYGNYGMYNSPYGTMAPGPIHSLNQFLFGIQTLVMSLGQAVQIIGMNTTAVQQLFQNITAMMEHAVRSWNEMNTIESTLRQLENSETKKRRRRLKALRWTLTAAVTYAVYRLIRQLLNASNRPRTLQR